jgi:PqqD family protein of HPr-rel-A system
MLKIHVDGELMFRYWPPECVVYNVSSGSSHVLDTLTAELLEGIQKTAMSNTEVHAFFVNKFVNYDDKEIEQHIDDMVSNLQKIFLIKK